jgi:hypothetical protein
MSIYNPVVGASQTYCASDFRPAMLAVPDVRLRFSDETPSARYGFRGPVAPRVAQKYFL